ncbi:uncharacterized protein HMPREF1541_00287 [Cyphellophora europaea CBS 101466]|uniref:Uncharacterized protein n=1 Tax=Cyphellophora europaea (strain CBS 101466) TaxID=1220924 RepID=W2SDJ1_CYPE1|nr:uncharacterized protein HMPREF1541_00287 [Cyphellophora europaea CBS 101466]ETN46103.1 hypothetical protein HMPREF1541_00287 [Cyphellophora europaea CBS 101466]
MSRSKQQLPHSLKHTKDDIDSTVRRLDDRIRRLGDSTLPKQPYLLSVPSDVPYRHNPHFVQTWYVGTPFKKREEQLQYMSFLPHQGEYEDLLKVEGVWADENGSFLDSEPSTRPISRAAPSTPTDQTNRKKISLKDYKRERVQPDSENTPSKTDEFKDLKPAKLQAPETDMPSRSPEPPVRKPVKQERGRSPIRAEDKKIHPPRLDGHASPRPKDTTDNPRPLKKQKLSNSPKPTVESRTETDVQKRIPKLLSPTLPSSPSHDHALPDLLTPDLPPSLLQALATPPPSSNGDSIHQHHRSESVRSILGIINEEGPRSTEKGPQSGLLGGSRVRSDSQHSARSASSVTGKVPTASKAGGKGGVVTPTHSRSPGPRQRHIIVLKYGKKNRKRVEALLKFKSKPKVVSRAADNTDSSRRDGKSLASKDVANPSHRERSPERRIPRAKIPAAEPVKRPSTPLTNGLRDSKHSASPTSKPQNATPTSRTALKSTAMRRVESVEGSNADPTTPGDKSIRSSTPLSTERSSRPPKASPRPASTPSTVSTSDEERIAWSRLDRDREYFALGRKLKHEGADLLNHAASATDMHKPMLLIIEALLCFMLNTAIQGYVRPRVDPGWSTILGYYNFVVQKTRHFAHLHGLVVQLGAVCRGHIQKAGMERLGRDPLPEEMAGAAPTPGSDGNTKSEDHEGYKRRYLLFREELIQNTEELQASWLKGSRLLGIEVLQREYPETWRGRSKDSGDRGKEKIKPENGLAKGYFLPVDPVTNTFEAAEYALKIMGEWADREDVDWRTSVRL